MDKDALLEGEIGCQAHHVGGVVHLFEGSEAQCALGTIDLCRRCASEGVVGVDVQPLKVLAFGSRKVTEDASGLQRSVTVEAVVQRAGPCKVDIERERALVVRPSASLTLAVCVVRPVLEERLDVVGDE